MENDIQETTREDSHEDSSRRTRRLRRLRLARARKWHMYEYAHDENGTEGEHDHGKH